MIFFWTLIPDPCKLQLQVHAGVRILDPSQNNAFQGLSAVVVDRNTRQEKEHTWKETVKTWNMNQAKDSITCCIV